MKVLILGAGVIGVSTAYELLKDGHEVVVVDRQPQAASETSFANASLIACGDARAWASPQAPFTMLKALVSNNQAIRMRLQADTAFWRWIFKFLGQCTTEREQANTRRKYALSIYSRTQLQRVAAETNIDYHQINRGLMYLHHTQKELDEAASHVELLKHFGHQVEVLDRSQIVELDPGYADADSIAGAVYAPTDESGDCYVFTQKLGRHCSDHGVKFVFDTQVQSILANGNRIESVKTSRGQYNADAVVVCLGPYSPQIVKPLEITLDICPVKGYSVTLPINSQHKPFDLGGVDETALIAYARIGDKARFTSVAEFGGYDTSYTPVNIERILAKAKKLFPNAADYSQPQAWACLRPVTPTGSPYLGHCRYDNLFLNTGQGHLGWTMACGSARITADIINNRTPDIDISGMVMT